MVTNIDCTPTPFHPPYSLMINEAIRSLDEEAGTTESSISQYIKAKFDGLPWGHDRLLPYYLNKLTAEGELVRGVKGRYIIAQDDAAEAIEPESKFIESQSNNVSIGAEKDGAIADLDDKGVPIACAGDRVMEVQPLATVSTPKRRGLVDPPSLIINGNAVEEAKVSQESDSKSKPVPKTRERPSKRKHDGDIEPLQPKKCRRPPKRERESVDSNKDAMAHDEDVERPKKKRKSKESSNQNAELKLLDTESGGRDGSSINPAETQKKSNLAPKRHGRHPKSKLELAGDKDEAKIVAKSAEKRKEREISACVAKRHRGRPPKAKPDMVDN